MANTCLECGTELLGELVASAVFPRGEYRYEVKGYELATGRVLFVEHTPARCRAARLGVR